MRIKTLIVTAIAALSVGALALPASAAGSVCYDLHVQVNDQIVDQADCAELPA